MMGRCSVNTSRYRVLTARSTADGPLPLAAAGSTAIAD
jgi:hypothetical protein